MSKTIYAPEFAELKRKLEAKGTLKINKVTTCAAGTDEFKTYWKLFEADDSVLEVTPEDNYKLYTFWTYERIKIANVD